MNNYLNKNGVKRIIMAGLNALNTSELDIVAHLKTIEKQIIWDLDSHYVDERADGLFSGYTKEADNLERIFRAPKIYCELTTLKKDIRIIGASDIPDKLKSLLRLWNNGL